MEIHLRGGGKGVEGVLDYGGIRQAAPEHGLTVRCYAITVRPVLGVIEGSGERVGMRWWEQVLTDLVGEREAAAVVEEGGGGEE